MHKKIAIFAITAVTLLSQYAIADLKEEIKRMSDIKEKLRQKRIARVNEKVDNYNKLKSLEMKVYSLEDKRVELKTKKINLEEGLDILEQELSKIQNENEKIEVTIGGIREFLVEKCEELKGRIEGGFPYYKDERKRRVVILEQRIRNKKLRLRGATDRLFQMLSEELAIGRTCEVYTDEVEREKVEVLRVGGIFSAYICVDGETVALLQKRIKGGKLVYRWNKNLELSTKDKLKNLFQSVGRPQKTCMRLPVDVTQGMKIDTGEVGEKGIWAWLVKGGPVMIPIGALALAILIMVIERLIAFRREYVNADVLMERVMRLWNKGYRDDAIKLCQTTSGPVARMLRTGLGQHQKGKKVVEESIHEVTLLELPKLERHLSTISVLAAAAPLLGLLGTVSGMISTFQVITYHGGGDPRLLAGGISEALITTEAGLIIAIPALLLHNYLSNKADRIASDMERNAVKLINSLPD